jgi:hypothetical protein
MENVEERESRPTMLSPRAGFTARVMARIEAQERARAYRRAIIGSGLLVLSAVALLASAGLLVASLAEVLVLSPSTLAPILQALEPLGWLVQAVLESVWLAASTFVGAVGSIPMLGYALGVFALTLLWIRVVFGSFQHPLAQPRWEV